VKQELYEGRQRSTAQMCWGIGDCVGAAMI